MGNLLPNPSNGRNLAGTGVLSRLVFESCSASMRQVESVIRELAHSEVPVLLIGERGVGKASTAQRIHDLSDRAGQGFCEFTCLGLTPDHLAAALQDESAAGGTVLLKDVADLSATCQLYLRDAQLNRTKFDRSVRFICASTADLEMEVKTRRLREDLYYQISAVCLRLPPLRQRKEDIPPLMEHFLLKYSQEYGRPIPKLSAETRRLFYEYAWPGNLRELEDAVRVLAALGDENLAMGGLRAILQKPPAERKSGEISLKAASRAASHEAEKELILNVLTRTRWNRRLAAKQLQISYKALLYKLKQIGCEEPGLL
ncbi:MAG TPA: sigma 54-interacting transcriptional regulator [Candidatus Sulfotelmatobacter sp.]|nr:sigma 54-interacting transcriptional regulator [Candidatus Sulfotelmatobacter sp.]